MWATQNCGLLQESKRNVSRWSHWIWVFVRTTNIHIIANSLFACSFRNKLQEQAESIGLPTFVVADAGRTQVCSFHWENSAEFIFQFLSSPQTDEIVIIVVKYGFWCSLQELQLTTPYPWCSFSASWVDYFLCLERGGENGLQYSKLPVL